MTKGHGSLSRRRNQSLRRVILTRAAEGDQLSGEGPEMNMLSFHYSAACTVAALAAARIASESGDI